MTKRYWIALFAVIAVLGLWTVAARAQDTTVFGSSGNPPPAGTPNRTPPVLVIDFPDQIQMHNMGIASDGTYYYTCNGGNAGAGQINTYDLNGTFVHSTPCLLDMRAIFYNSADGFLYAKTYEADLYRVDPVNGATVLMYSGQFSWSQSSPALTPDGLTLLEYEDGTVRFLDFQTGQLQDTLLGLYFGGYPSNEAIGTDGTRIYTWDGTLVYVYDMNGGFIESYNIPNGHFGFSLKLVNGLLFASDDGGGGTGHWWGYDVGAPTPVESTTWGRIKQSFLH